MVMLLRTTPGVRLKMLLQRRSSSALSCILIFGLIRPRRLTAFPQREHKTFRSFSGRGRASLAPSTPSFAQGCWTGALCFETACPGPFARAAEKFFGSASEGKLKQKRKGQKVGRLGENFMD